MKSNFWVSMSFHSPVGASTVVITNRCEVNICVSCPTLIKPS